MKPCKKIQSVHDPDYKRLLEGNDEIFKEARGDVDQKEKK